MSARDLVARCERCARLQAENERLQLEARAARRAKDLLHSELRAMAERFGPTDDYVQVLRKMVAEDQALAQRRANW